MKKPFLIAYDGTHLYPGVAPETRGLMETKAVERYDHVAASGKTISYRVGGRDFIECEFPFQDSTLKAEWEAFWLLIDGGQAFYFCDDASIPICGDGTESGDGSVCGQTGYAVAVVATYVKCDQMEISFEDEDAYGYWRVNLRMREVV